MVKMNIIGSRNRSLRDVCNNYRTGVLCMRRFNVHAERRIDYELDYNGK